MGACVAGALATLVLSGCQKPEAQAEPPPPTVGVIESRRMTVPIVATPNGTTRALEEVAIRARVRGFLTEQHFEEGSEVKKDQLLFVIDEKPYKVALQSAQAKQEQAEAALKKAELSKAREVATAQLALAQAQLLLAQVAERRTRALLARNATSREDLDKAEADRKKSEAQVEADKASAEQSKSDYDVNILAARAQVADAKAAVNNAELDLGYCRMFAPFGGRIGEAKVKVGNLVGTPTIGSGDNTALATVQQLDPMGVDIQVSSRYLDRATRLTREGLTMRLTRPGIEGEQEHPYEGQCYFIDNTIEPTTSTFLAKAKIPNPEGSLLPGEYVKLRLVVDRVENAVVVPEQAVMETQAGPVVYVVDHEGKVAIQRVNAEQTYEGLRVITEGLDAGVPVIVEGLQMVRPGIVVKTERAILPRPARKPPKNGTPKTSPRGEEASGEAPKPGKTEAAEPVIEPGGPRSAVKAEEDARPVPEPDASPKS
jgi:membrane fusion protein (multidrug efflux system)